MRTILPTLRNAAIKTVVLGLCATMLPGANGRITDFEDRLLVAHNEERRALGIAPLKWDDELARGAQEWADHLSRSGRFEHSPNRPGQPLEGENIWGGTPAAYTPERMVGLWIAEKRFYRQGIFPINSTTGDPADVSHYTQVIWRSTREVGCGRSRAGGEEILVCRYSQPGNIVGYRPI